MADVMAEHTHVLCLSWICHSPTKADNQNEPFAAQSGLLGSLSVYVCVWLVCKFVRGPWKLTTMETNLAHGDMKLKLEKLFNNSVSVCHFPFSSFPFSLLQYSVSSFCSIFVLVSVLCAVVQKPQQNVDGADKPFWSLSTVNFFWGFWERRVEGEEALKHLRLVPPSLIYVAIENI